MAYTEVAATLGIPVAVVAIIVIWEAVWTALAMWRSARIGSPIWFIFFFAINILGIPEIIYLIMTGKKGKKSKKKKRR